MAFSADELKRYDRHILLKEFGVAGQERIANARVLVIGSGGLGSPAILYLAAAGVGTLGIADGDVIDLSNLQRQIIHSTPDLHRSKAQSAKNRIQNLNPEVKVNLFEVFVTAANIVDIISDYDFVVDGTDNYGSKFLINDACVLTGKPFVHAGILAFQGQLLTVIPHKTPCYRCVFAEPPPPGTVPSCNQVGVLGTVPGVLGTMQAAECIKYVLGIGTLATGKLMVYDALHNTFNTIGIKKHPACPVCGANPSITKPTDYKAPLPKS